ncbi:hypothetical protein [Rhodoflexus caldus]|uniref:hypothetical protein n=1 Tax=Rhodoflexus caldus TaxID=2891236 RepID=UPI00202A9971|nr:hypothetical protein [Rhodoflexus caldus]
MKIKLTGAWLFAMFLSICSVWGQTPTDGLMMSPYELCSVLQYSRSQWKQYWEGSLKRNNENIGTLTSQSVAVMAAYGVNKRLNLMFSLPYIANEASAGNMKGMRGIQDLSLWAKYRWLHQPTEIGALSSFITLGGSVPATRYVPDWLPFSIGLGAKTASARAIVHYRLNRGWYATAQSGFTYRSNIRIFRDAYQFDGQLFYTNEVQVPHAADATLRIGYLKKNTQVEVFADHQAALSGDDIRRHDMPFPTNRMIGTAIGCYGKFSYDLPNQSELSLTAQLSQVVQGRNVGQATSFSLGVLYAFYVKKTN